MKFVVNLSHRPDRYQEFCKNMLSANMNLNDIKKFDAIYDEDFGGLGCAKSHSAVLSWFLTYGDISSKSCTVFEDDFILRVDAESIASTIQKVELINPDWKVILLSGTHTITLPNLHDDIAEIFESQSASGYIVNRNFIPQLLNVYNNSINLMERFRLMQPRTSIYHSFAIDQAWKRLQHDGGWYCRIPMLGYQTESYSDIEKKTVNYSTESS